MDDELKREDREEKIGSRLRSYVEEMGSKEGKNDEDEMTPSLHKPSACRHCVLTSLSLSSL